MPMIQTDSQHYTDIADAIRDQNGTQDVYYPEEMAAAVRAIGNVDDVTVDGVSVVNSNKVAEINLTGKQDTIIPGPNIQLAQDGKTLSATNTTYSDFIGATSQSDGDSGLVKKPLISDKDKFLKGDGTWDNVSHVENLTDLSDISISSPKEGQVLLYDSSLQKWINGLDYETKGAAVGIKNVTSLITPHSGITLSSGFIYKAWQIGNTIFLYAGGSITSGASATEEYILFDIDQSIAPSSIYVNYAHGAGDSDKRVRVTSTNVYVNAGSWCRFEIYWQVETTIYSGYINPIIYSTDEIEIGVWTDGKPLYQKTIHINALPSTAVTAISYPHGIANIDTICGYEAVARWSSGQIVQIPRLALYDKTTWSGTANSSFAVDAINKTDIVLLTGSDRSALNADFTIRYTKTTDTPGSGTWTTSGQYTEHYSTSEQIVGTWIDGRPIYQRTYNLPSYTEGVNNFIEHGVTNLDMVLKLFGTCKRSNKRIALPFIHQTTSDWSINVYDADASTGKITFWAGINNAQNITDIYVTMQYLKTTT